ncbi:hypothetical protein CHS0354_041032 [Potamilus streckersoni]|uniref:Uncharacterized protein n=1 Tax=Potamilus streckersoni TaxID=2493646 RepID=A0AAE0W3J4_9BIVA|nr:hypothetical protein CHS0354_041032 [Potamilus streckersoni]
MRKQFVPEDIPNEKKQIGTIGEYLVINNTNGENLVIINSNGEYLAINNTNGENLVIINSNGEYLAINNTNR